MIEHSIDSNDMTLFYCGGCNKNYEDLTKYRRHMKNTHNGKPPSNSSHTMTGKEKKCNIPAVNPK